MKQTSTFGARSTADQVLAGIDLTGKHILVTDCDSGIGLATTSALAANGAHVIAAARTLQEAAATCRQVGYLCSPLECNLGDLESVAAAGHAVRDLQQPLDAIVANAGIADLAAPRIRDGVEEHFLANHLGHFALVNDLAGVLRDAIGRVVIVSSAAVGEQGAALYAKELARRLKARAIAVNAANPGVVRGMTSKQVGMLRRLAHYAAFPFLRKPAQGAATVALLAGSPNAKGISGEYWQDCAIARGNPLSDDGTMAIGLWNAFEEIIAKRRAAGPGSLAHAA